MKKVVIYGMGHDYRENYDFMRSMEQRGEIEILAVSDKKVEHSCVIDGLQAVAPERIPFLPFDCILVASKAFFSEIARELVSVHGISRSRILPLFLFLIPGMTFELHEEICAKRWSILCNNCFGGFLSYRFGLEHRSPFKNLFIADGDLIRFADNIEHYLAQEPVFVCWKESPGYYDEKRYPVLRLDDILLNCNHDTDPDEALATYARRVAKVDPSALLLVLVTDDEGIEREFQEHFFGCPKLCISSVENCSEKTLHLSADNRIDLQNKANDLLGNPAYSRLFIDLLLGKEEFVY